LASALPGEIEDLKHCASMAYPDAVGIEATAAKGKPDTAQIAVPCLYLAIAAALAFAFSPNMLVH
jgi:hypothetical protein